MRAEQRLESVGTGLSEVRERLTSAETQQAEREKRMNARLDELQKMLEDGLRFRGGRDESGSSGDRATQGGPANRSSGASSGPQEHVVLLHFAELMHIGEMRGIEARHRSEHQVTETPVATESKPFHDWLAVKFRTHESAAKYPASLKDVFRDGAGRPVEVIHKGAKEARPPHITRRGAMLHPFYGVFTNLHPRRRDLAAAPLQQGGHKHTVLGGGRRRCPSGSPPWHRHVGRRRGD